MYVKKVTSIAVGLAMAVALSGCVYSRGVRYVDTRTQRPTRPEIHTFTVVKKEVHRERPRINKRETKREVHRKTTHNGPRKAPDRRERDRGAEPRKREIREPDRGDRHEKVENQERHPSRHSGERSRKPERQDEGKKADSKPDNKRAEARTRSHKPKAEETKREPSEKDRRRD